VLDAIVRMCEGRFDIAGLFSMFDDGRGVTPSVDALTKCIWGPGRNRLVSGAARRYLLPLYPSAVGELGRQLAFDHARCRVDLVVSTSSAAIKGLRPPEGVPHVCYCHSPARYLWSQTEEYGRGKGGFVRRIGLATFGPRLRAWDLETSGTVSRFVANSTHTQREIERCYERSSVVVHPPVRTEYFTLPTQASARSGWLYVGALEPYKRVDLAIEAAALAGAPLTVVGTGSQQKHVRSIAGPGVTFAGRVGDDALRTMYQHASLLIFPQIEDFGIVAVEAQACGTPVVARRAGGALDTVIDGRTGVLFDEPTPKAVADAAARCAALGEVSSACRENAERFGEARFECEMLAVIEQALHGDYGK
jgi:glycosyltransferase involved in cell wall biosynthesis